MSKNKVVLTYVDVNEEICEETIWVERMKDENYKVLNIPFFAPNIALHDIISVTKEDGKLHFDALVSPSGHSTIQLVFLEKTHKERVIKDIERLGCSWEGMENQDYLAIDIPASINYKDVTDYLDTEVSNETIDYKEACVA